MKNAKHFVKVGWKWLLIGALLIIVANILSFTNKEGSYISLFAVGSGLLGLGFVYIIKYKRVAKNPEKNESFELAQNDERNIFVAQRSAELSLSFIMMLDLVLLIICSCIASLEVFTTPISLLICVHVLIHLFTYKYVNKKY